MKRRNFLVGAGAASIGGSALLGSGAFSRIESDRAVTIAVAEDPDAYLGLNGCADSANSSYTNIDENGHLEIDMTSGNPTDPGGQGINSNSRSWFDRVFQICNQGKEQACVWIRDEEWPTVPTGEGYPDEGEPRIEFYIEDDRDSSIVGSGNAVPIDIGGCICVGIMTRSHGLEEGDSVFEELDEEIQIIADVGENCADIPVDDQQASFRLAYEDREQQFDDYDYNDFVVDVDATFREAAVNGLDPEDYLANPNGNGEYLGEIELEFTPMAKSAGDDHDFEMDLLLDPEESMLMPDACEGEWRLYHNGTQVDDGTFNGGGAEEIEVWGSTEDLFDTDGWSGPPSNGIINGDLNQEGAGPDGEDCVPHVESATVVFDFDGACEFLVDDFDPLGEPDNPHGEGSETQNGADNGLFFNPTIEDAEGPWGKGDLQMLVTHQEWLWPTEETHIWDAYEAVEDDGDGKPEFPADGEGPGADDWRDDAADGEVFDLC